MPKILVIEDTPNIQKLTMVNLACSGYKVFIAGNGKEGLNMTRKENPNLILLDLMLPDISGWDVLKTLKADTTLQNIPIIIMTAVIAKGEDFKIHSNSAAGHIVKPFGVDELLVNVKTALEG